VSTPLLEIRELSVRFPTAAGVVCAVDQLSCTLEHGQTLGVVGESGSGKSVTFLAALQLLPKAVAQIEGQILLNGEDLLTRSASQIQAIRGARVGMIFQDPMSALHPLMRIGDQIAEIVRAHTGASRADAHARAISVLRSVGIPNPDTRARQYPHELSGGMRQRVIIAMAIVLEPELIIADEPTTALDTTVEAQILELIDELKDRRGIGVVLVSHSLATISSVADTVMVMYAGRVVEHGSAGEIFSDPTHPYTQGLLASIPTIDHGRGHLVSIPGSPPSLIDLPAGCSFAPRCVARIETCTAERPTLTARTPTHVDACLVPPSARRITPAAVAAGMGDQ
jgi:oligopeptide/dipeptide ABC transporter ATP-binding protein